MNLSRVIASTILLLAFPFSFPLTGCALRESKGSEFQELTGTSERIATGATARIEIARKVDPHETCGSFFDDREYPCPPQNVAFDYESLACSLSDCTVTAIENTERPWEHVLSVTSASPGAANVTVVTRSRAGGERMTSTVTVEFYEPGDIVVERRTLESLASPTTAVSAGSSHTWCASITTRNAQALRSKGDEIHFFQDGTALTTIPYEGVDSPLGQSDEGIRAPNTACATFNAALSGTSNIVVSYGSLLRTHAVRTIDVTSITNVELLTEKTSTYVAAFESDVHTAATPVASMECSCDGTCTPFPVFLRVTDANGSGYMNRPLELSASGGGTIGAWDPQSPFFFVKNVTAAGALTGTFGSATLSIPLTFPDDCAK